MNPFYLAAQLLIAVVAAGIANVLLPRRLPGKFLGLMLVGLVGVWLGEWGFGCLNSLYSVNHTFLAWGLLGVPLIPAIVGSLLVIYVVTTFVKWGRL